MAAVDGAAAGLSGRCSSSPAVGGVEYRLAGRGSTRVWMGVNLNHGVVLVGNIGSPRRMEFTGIGDAVNLGRPLTISEEVEENYEL